MGDITVRYTNGEHGIVRSENGIFRFFLTKRGLSESVRIIEPVISGITLPDHSILLAKFTDGRIIGEQLTGQFTAVTVSENLQISGNLSADGEFISLTLEPTLKSLDTGMAMIQREVLKMALAGTGDSSSVPGITTDTAENVNIPILSSNISSNMIIQRFDGEGVIRIVTRSNNIDQSITNTQNLNLS